MTVHRYAVYFAPAPGHALWRAGCAWLGRDARAGQPLARPAQAAVSEPWRYGFHATLKAPMRLRESVSAADLRQALQSIAGETPGFALPRLQVGWLSGRFLALRPSEPIDARHPLRRLADRCVRELEGLRAALTPAERARYLPGDLSPRQQQNVQQLGYAHVLDDWRFHMTLSNSCPDCNAPAAQALRESARRHFEAVLAEPLTFDALCLFAEPAAGDPFVLTERIALAAA